MPEQVFGQRLSCETDDEDDRDEGTARERYAIALEPRPEDPPVTARRRRRVGFLVIAFALRR